MLTSNFVLGFILQGVLTMKGLMDRCMAREELIGRLKEKAKAAEVEHNELKALWEVQVKKLDLTRKTLEETEN